MFVVLTNGSPGEGVIWWGPFEDIDAADKFIETVGQFVECFGVELNDPDHPARLHIFPRERWERL